MNKRIKDLTGRAYGRLLVLQFNGIVNQRSVWLCKCDCGKETIVVASSLNNGKTKSCGCLAKESLYQVEHGLAKSRFYSIWRNMKRRCNSDTFIGFKNYKGKGVKVSTEWNQFKKFKEDMFNSYSQHSIVHGEKNTTLDRIEQNGDYCKDNCKWATYQKQQRNRSNNAVYEIDGIKMPLVEISEKYKINYNTLYGRLKNGWGIEKSIKTKQKNNTLQNENIV